MWFSLGERSHSFRFQPVQYCKVEGFCCSAIVPKRAYLPHYRHSETNRHYRHSEANRHYRHSEANRHYRHSDANRHYRHSEANRHYRYSEANRTVKLRASPVIRTTRDV